MDQPVRLLLVDDHPFFRQGVKFYLDSVPEFQLLGECSSGEEALEMIPSAQPDVILMDLEMGGMGGIEATKALLEINPRLRVLILTSFGGSDKIQQAMRAGAAGYCIKSAPPEELVSAVKAVAAGGTYLGRGITPQALIQMKPGQQEETTPTGKLLETLTPREKDVLELLARGLGNKDIAGELVVSEKTVKTHVANILQKLHVNTRTQAALLAREQGLGGGN